MLKLLVCKVLAVVLIEKKMICIKSVQSWLTDLEIKANESKRKAIAGGADKFVWYSKEKNKDIKEKFAVEGKKLSSNYLSRSSGGSAGGEWLYDFTLRELDEEKNLISIPLVAEIELSDSKSGGLIYDFNKLLQADSSVKVFIFQQKNEAEFKEIFAGIQVSLNLYKHRTNGQYLVACWITSEYRFIFKSYEIKATPVVMS